MLVRIRRQRNKDSKPYIQEFAIDTGERMSVSAILSAINSKIEKKDEIIKWDCSCLEGKCGACAIVVNHVPVLACDTFINPEEKTLFLEPLAKFPVIADLRVDRAAIFEQLKKAEIFRGETAESEPSEFDYQYKAAKCLKCGICLEVCPNYKNGKSHFGAVVLNEAYLLASNSKDRRTELKKASEEHFLRECSSCMNCRNYCPVHISSLASSTYMQRKIKLEKKGKK